MDNRSQQKVIKAGFTIIRKDNYPSVRIKIKYVEKQEWRTYEKYKTKAERDKIFEQLMQNDKVIND